MAFASRGFCQAAIALLMVVVLAVPAFAQAGDDKTPYYDVPALPPGKPWVQWVMAAFFVALCLLGAMKNPHRTHLD